MVKIAKRENRQTGHSDPNSISTSNYPSAGQPQTQTSSTQCIVSRGIKPIQNFAFRSEDASIHLKFLYMAAGFIFTDLDIGLYRLKRSAKMSNNTQHLISTNYVLGINLSTS